MMLIGMFDSPFVRRVAVSMKYLKMPFEHANWSVGKDQERIREFNPLGRVPTLVLDNGDIVIESAAILDYLDDSAGPDRALLPASGTARREALRLISHSIGAAEKGRDLIYERVMRPPDKRYAPWVERCVTQLYGTLRVLDEHCVTRPDGAWLLGDRLTQADITLACVVTFISESVSTEAPLDAYPVLRSFVARCESLPEFRATYAPWGAPVVK
ncbi:MAG: glutathione S-transferase [Gammaproteobacteria bacterium]|nr:glutathione S-transferase [Gammaproteobacteria bacterium]